MFQGRRSGQKSKPFVVLPFQEDMRAAFKKGLLFLMGSKPISANMIGSAAGHIQRTQRVLASVLSELRLFTPTLHCSASGSDFNGACRCLFFLDRTKGAEIRVH